MGQEAMTMTFAMRATMSKFVLPSFLAARLVKEYSRKDEEQRLADSSRKT